MLAGGKRGGNVLRRQPAGQHPVLSQILRQQRPVETAAGAAVLAFNISIEQQRAGIGIGGLGAADVVGRAHAHRFQIRTAETATVSSVFIAVKLQQIERHAVEHAADFVGAGIDKQAHRRHKRRQRGHDFPCPRGIDATLAAGKKHQPHRVGAGSRGGERVFHPRDAADFDSDPVHIGFLTKTVFRLP